MNTTKIALEASLKELLKKKPFDKITIADLTEDLAAEQKARSTYDNILRVVRDMPEIADPIKFLRAREIVHFQRFGEALRSVQENLDAKNFYAFNPEFDKKCK